MSKLDRVYDLGQAVWLDYIRRSFLATGGLKDLIGDGLKGVTSNPSIFEKAIAGSSDYDEALQILVGEQRSIDEIYESLVLEDIARAADQMEPVFDATEGKDGFVSIEVSPKLANDTEGTVAEGKRLFASLDRPNVMIKVPATAAGIPAIERLLANGVNVNVTLIFSLEHYKAVADAYLSGLENLAASGGDVGKVASVASFFISRLDSAVDQQLEKTDRPELMGKTAIANARVAFSHFHDYFSGSRWEKLAEMGARVQRLLWASTSTKNPTLPDTLYVDSLIGEDTVNTVPPATLNAFVDHGSAKSTLATGLEEAQNHLEMLKEAGIDLSAVTQKLQDDGVAAFAKSFESLVASIHEKREHLGDWRSNPLMLLS
jgi:transaldolase